MGKIKSLCIFKVLFVGVLLSASAWANALVSGATGRYGDIVSRGENQIEFSDQNLRHNVDLCNQGEAEKPKLSGTVYVERSPVIEFKTLPHIFYPTQTPNEEEAVYSQYKIAPYVGGTDSMYVPGSQINVSITSDKEIVGIKIKDLNHTKISQAITVQYGLVLSEALQALAEQLGNKAESCESAVVETEIADCNQEYAKIENKIYTESLLHGFTAGVLPINCKLSNQNDYQCMGNIELYVSEEYWESIGSSDNSQGMAIIDPQQLQEIAERPLDYNDICFAQNTNPVYCNPRVLQVEFVLNDGQTIPITLAQTNSYYWKAEDAVSYPLGQTLSKKESPTIIKPDFGDDVYVAGPCACKQSQTFIDCSDIFICDDSNTDTIDLCHPIEGCSHETSNGCPPPSDPPPPTDPCPGSNKPEPGVCGCSVADTDIDGDGTFDCHDNCLWNPNKTEPGICGCKVADTDSDSDGIFDCQDECPSDPNKIKHGICGCGAADEGDDDGDGLFNCIDIVDLCPGFQKSKPGVCGCDVADTDQDKDGTPDCHDHCPLDPLKITPGFCGCGVSEDECGKVVTPLVEDETEEVKVCDHIEYVPYEVQVEPVEILDEVPEEEVEEEVVIENKEFPDIIEEGVTEEYCTSIGGSFELSGGNASLGTCYGMFGTGCSCTLSGHNFTRTNFMYGFFVFLPLFLLLLVTRLKIRQLT